MKLLNYLFRYKSLVQVKTLQLFISVFCVGFSASAQFGPQQVVDENVYGITKIVTADLNNNGFPDIITSQKYYNNNKISYFINLGTGSFGPQNILTTNVNSSEGIAAGDLSGNGWNDIVAISQNPYTVLWFPNSEGSFPEEILIDSGLIMPEDVEIVDIDNDGLLDVVVLDHTNIIVYYNLGNGLFNKVVTPNNEFEYYAFTIADIDGDGFKDIIIGSGIVLVYMNEGGSFITHDIARSNSIVNSGFSFMLHSADLNGNGTSDLVIDGKANSEISWYANDGNGYFTFMQAIETTNQCRSVATADFNNNGSLDIVATLYQEGEVAIYYNNGEGTFGEKTLISIGLPANTVATAPADLNNSGFADIIWAHPLSFHLNSTVQGINSSTMKGPEINVAPNPFIDQLHIYAKENSTLSVFDMQGRCLYSNIPIEAGINIFTHPLPPQLYIFQFTTTSQVVSKKVVKK